MQEHNVIVQQTLELRIEEMVDKVETILVQMQEVEMVVQV
jgi:hypothetical protein